MTDITVYSKYPVGNDYMYISVYNQNHPVYYVDINRS